MLFRSLLPPGSRFAFQKNFKYGATQDGWRTLVLSGPPLLSSANVRSAKAQADAMNTNLWTIAIELDAAGALAFEHVTTANVRRRLAILVDGEVMMAPIIQTPIPGGKLVITMGGAGPSQETDAKLLAAALSPSNH